MSLKSGKKKKNCNHDTVFSCNRAGLVRKRDYAKCRLEQYAKGNVNYLQNEFFKACFEDDEEQGKQVAQYLKSIVQKGSLLEEGMVLSRMECFKNWWRYTSER